MSPDGMYYWDGQQWASTLSPDGRFRWNGSRWEPMPAMAYPAPYYPGRTLQREPTSWTQPLQIAVVARYVATGLYGLALPFWMQGYMSAVMQRSIQQQRQAYPPGQGPPPGFTDLMNSIVTGSIWIGAIIGLAITAVAIVGAIKRWTWAYYLILVLLGFTLLGTVFNLINLAAGGALTARQLQPPEFTQVAAYVIGAIDTVLFVWMLIALVRRGPWAMKQVISASGPR
jgi:hypothetical protein